MRWPPLSRRIGRLQWIEDLVEDGRFAVRLLSRERRFCAAVVIVLAVGIAVTGTFFTLMNAIVLRGLPIKKVDRVADISTRDSTGREQQLSYADLGEVRAASKSFRALAAFLAAPLSISDDRQPAERFSGAYVTAGTLTLMGEVPVAGRDFRPEDDRQGASPVVVIGRSLWQRRYAGREALIGQSVRVNGLLATVVGIMPERSRFPTNAEVWLPLAQLPGLFDRNRNARNLSVMGWLSDGYTVHSADDELRAFAGRLQQQFPDTNRGIRIEAVPVNDQYSGVSHATGMDRFHHRWRVGAADCLRERREPDANALDFPHTGDGRSRLARRDTEPNRTPVAW